MLMVRIKLLFVPSTPRHFMYSVIYKNKPREQELFIPFKDEKHRPQKKQSNFPQSTQQFFLTRVFSAASLIWKAVSYLILWQV